MVNRKDESRVEENQRVLFEVHLRRTTVLSIRYFLLNLSRTDEVKLLGTNRSKTTATKSAFSTNGLI